MNTIYSGIFCNKLLYIVYKNLINGVLHNYTHQRQFQYENTVRMSSNHKTSRRFAPGGHEKYDIIRGFICVIATLKEEIPKSIPIVSGHRIHTYI